MHTGDRPVSGISRRRLLVTAAAAGSGLLAGCFAREDGSGDRTTTAMSATETEPSRNAWQSVELSTAGTGETFTVASLEAPVAIQSFAVWCEQCQRQSEAMRNLDRSITLLGLNTDPNESERKVSRHWNTNSFSWRFAVAPAEMTESLIEEFGATVVNAPSTPIVVVCEDGSTEFLAGSVKPAAEIEAVADAC